MSLDVIYRLSPQTRGVIGAVINRDNELQGTTPFDTRVRTTTLALNGGTYSFTAQKTGYLSKVQYKLFLIRNPYFDPNEQNNPRRELEGVFLEYGSGVKNFNTSFNKNFPEFLNNTPDTRSLGDGAGIGPNITSGGGGIGSTIGGESIPFDTRSLFDDFGNPINNDPFLRPDGTGNGGGFFEGSPQNFGGGSTTGVGGPNETEIPYSNVPQYVIAVLKYVNGILDENFVQLASSTNEILMEFDLEENVTNGGGNNGGGNTGGGTEPPRTVNAFLKISTSTPNAIRIFRNNDPSTLQLLTNKVTDIIAIEGDVFRINSTDNSIYRIKSIKSGNTILAERQSENQSVNYELTLDESISLEIDVEDVASIYLECFGGGSIIPVHIHQDYLQRPPARNCKVIGD